MLASAISLLMVLSFPFNSIRVKGFSKKLLAISIVFFVEANALVTTQSTFLFIFVFLLALPMVVAFSISSSLIVFFK